MYKKSPVVSRAGGQFAFMSGVDEGRQRLCQVI